MYKNMYRSVIFGSLILIVLGFIASSFFTRHIDKTQRAQLLEQAQYAALLVSADDIASLSATEEDLKNATYQRLKENFTAFREVNPETQFVYIMGYRPEIRKQFFYVDSEPIESEDYSPPGQIFPDTREEDIDYYLAGEPYTDGPYQDSWGEWVSGYVPVKNAEGEVAGLVGIDIATSVWQEQIAFVRITVAIITILLCAILYFLMRRLFKNQQSIDTLTTENMHLSHDKTALTEAQSLAQIGRVMFYVPKDMVMLDKQFASTLGASSDRLSMEQFYSFIHPDDRQAVEAVFTEMQKDISYSWFDTRAGTADRGYRKYHFFGNIERDERGALKRFSGIMQDVTDIQK